MRGDANGRLWFSAALVEIAVLLLINGLADSSVNVTGGFAIAALTAAMGVGPRLAAAVGLVAVAAAIGSTLLLPESQYARAVRVGFVALGSGLGAVAASRRQGREEHVSRTARLAAAAQRVMLRPPPTRLGSYRLAALYRSATTEVNLGGDFYDVAFHPSGAVVAIVGDVLGHGYDAVETAAAVLASFRVGVFASDGPEPLVAHLDRDISPGLEDEAFITLLVLWMFVDGTASAVSLGHPRPWILSRTGVREMSEMKASPPLGLPQSAESTPLVLSPSDVVLVHTDGLSEARDRQRNFFPLEATIRASSGLALPEMIEHLAAEATRFSGGTLLDDVALLGVEYAAPVSGSTPAFSSSAARG